MLFIAWLRISGWRRRGFVFFSLAFTVIFNTLGTNQRSLQYKASKLPTIRMWISACVCARASITERSFLPCIQKWREPQTSRPVILIISPVFLHAVCMPVQIEECCPDAVLSFPLTSCRQSLIDSSDAFLAQGVPFHGVGGRKGRERDAFIVLAILSAFLLNAQFLYLTFHWVFTLFP